MFYAMDSADEGDKTGRDPDGGVRDVKPIPLSQWTENSQRISSVSPGLPHYKLVLIQREVSKGKHPWRKRMDLFYNAFLFHTGNMEMKDKASITQRLWGTLYSEHSAHTSRHMAISH